MRGRTALYGHRHLLQLVAIKKLQARGLSLAQVQEQLLGASDETLGGLAKQTGDAQGQAAAVQGADERRASSRAFWKSRPVAVSDSPAKTEPVPPDRDAERPGLASAYQDVDLLQAVGLASQVTLLLAATRQIHPSEIAPLRRAAAPLIRHLEDCRLIEPLVKGEGHDHVDSQTD
jgi:hypothetical protein